MSTQTFRHPPFTSLRGCIEKDIFSKLHGSKKAIVVALMSAFLAFLSVTSNFCWLYSDLKMCLEQLHRKAECYR